jgi:hypothetical protein
MLARIWSGRTLACNAAEYFNFMMSTGVMECLKTAGNKGVLILEERFEDITGFTFISLWKDHKSIQNFSKMNGNEALLYPGDYKFLVDYEKKVKIVKYTLFETNKKDNKITMDLPPNVII